MKVVLDTNVLVSGLLYPDSIPGRIVTAWRESRFDLVTSSPQLSEVGRVLAYPKIRKVLRWDDEAIGTFLRQLLLRAELVELGAVSSPEVRDPADPPILATLIKSQADLLVTGDRDLLALGDDYAIVEPAEFAERL